MEGDNTLAVEIHQSDSGSSDISFNLELEVVRNADNGVLANDIDIDGDELKSLGDLRHLPVTRKSSLIERQANDRPFGGLASQGVSEIKHIFASPGPIYEPEGFNADYWRIARALYAAGFRLGDVVYNTFSYHFTPAGSMLESGAHAIGCAVFPAGPGQSSEQARVASHIGTTAYVGTPDFLAVILATVNTSL